MASLTLDQLSTRKHNASYQDVTGVLKTHGFIRQPKTHQARETWQHPQFPELMITFGDNQEGQIDANGVRDCVTVCREAAEKQQALTGAKPAPSWLDTALKKQLKAAGYDFDIKKGEAITLWDAGYPELRFTTSLANKNKFDTELASLNEKRGPYAAQLKQLSSEYGVTVTRDRKLHLRLSQPFFGIQESVTVNIEKCLSLLEGVKQNMDNQILESAELLENFKQQGCTLERDDNRITISHDDLRKPLTLTCRTFHEIDALDAASLEIARQAAQKIVTIIPDEKPDQTPAPAPLAAPAIPAVSGQRKIIPIIPDEKPDQTPAPAPLAAPAIPTVPGQTIRPFTVPVSAIPAPPPPIPVPIPPAATPQKVKKSTQAALIVDACTLIDMAAPISDQPEHTWLDLLTLASQRPSTKKIFIPAAVVYETTGEIAHEDETGATHWKKVKERDNSKEIERFLAQASHWRLDSNGQGQLIPGVNPNIVIYETPYDRKLLDERLKIDEMKASIQALIASGKRDEADALKNERDTLKTYWRAELCMTESDPNKSAFGETAMVHLARELREECPIFLVTSDYKFINDYYKQAINTATPVTTDDGYPIGTATTLQLVIAEFRTYRKSIQLELGLSQLPSIDSFVQDAQSHNDNSDKDHYHHPYGAGPGFFRDTNGMITRARSLGTIYRNGAQSKIPPTESAITNPTATTPESQETPPAQESEPVTLGSRIREHREARAMSQEELADAVVAVISHRRNRTVNKDTIHAWETCRTLPNADEYRALKQILVDENEKVTDKETARAAFDALYTRSLEAFKKAEEDRTDEDKAALHHFRLKVMRGRLGAQLNHAALAEKISTLLPGVDGIDEQTVDAELIRRVLEGEHSPSPGLLNAVIEEMNALSRYKGVEPLADSEKTELFALREGPRQRAIVDTALQEPLPSSNGANGNGKVKERKDGIGRRAVPGLQQKLCGLFMKEEPNRPYNTIAASAGTTSLCVREILHSSARVDSTIPALKKTGGALRTLLEFENPDAITKFDAFFEEFIEAVQKQREQQAGQASSGQQPQTARL